MKFLVVRAGRVGDMVMMTPALRAILDAHPDAEIHLLTSKDGRRILKTYDVRLTQFFIYDRRAWNVTAMQKRLREQLSKERYERVYCFEYNPTYSKLVESLGASVHVIKHSGQVKHYAQRCLDTLLEEDRPAASQYWVNLPVSREAREKSARVLDWLGDDDILIGLHPSFSGVRKGLFRSKKHYKNKLWPIESFAQLGDLLHHWADENNRTLHVMVDLLSDEKKIGEAVTRASHGRIKVVMPEPDIERYKATLQRMDVLVTPDTGPMHIAAAVGTPLVTLFSEKDPRDCGPFVPADKFIVLRAEDAPNPGGGIAAISPESVFQACLQMLGRRD